MKDRLLQFVVGLGIAFIGLYFAFRDIDIFEVIGEVSRINLVPIYITIGLTLISHWFRGLRWRLFFKDLAPDKNKTYPFFSATMIGYAVNNLIPRAGEIAKAVHLGQLISISKSRILGTVVLERLLDFILLILVFGMTSIFYHNQINLIFPGLGELAIFIFLVAVGTTILFSIITPIQIRGMVKWMLFKFNKKIAVRIAQILTLFSSGVGSLKASPHSLGIIFTSIMIFVLYIFMAWVPLFAFSFQTELQLNVVAGAAIMAVSAIGIILPSPGGTGTFHFFATAVLVNLFSVSKIDAISYSTIVHMVSFILTTLIGIAVFLYDRYRLVKN